MTKPQPSDNPDTAPTPADIARERAIARFARTRSHRDLVRMQDATLRALRE